MERSYSNYYGADNNRSALRVSTPSAQRRSNNIPPRSPHVTRVNSVKKDDYSTLPRSPKAKFDRRKQIQQMHVENEKLCDSVSETYMVRNVFLDANAGANLHVRSNR